MSAVSTSEAQDDWSSQTDQNRGEIKPTKPHLSGSVTLVTDSDWQKRLYTNFKLSFPDGLALNTHTYDRWGEVGYFGRHGITANLPWLPSSVELGTQFRTYPAGIPPREELRVVGGIQISWDKK